MVDTSPSLPPLEPDLDGLTRWLEGRSDVTAAWLFGSRARGDARARSDVDLALWIDDAPRAGLLDLVALEVDVASALAVPLEAVDVVDVIAAPPLLRQAIFCDGEILIDRDPARRIDLQARTLHEAEIARRLWDERRRVRADQLGACS